MKGDLVTESAHNVVPICPETNDDTGTTECEDPKRDGNLAADLRGRPDEVDGGIWADGVGDIVGAVGERGSRGGQDLEERVGVLGAVVEVLAGGVSLLDVAAEEVAVILLIHNVLFDTAERGVLHPVESDSRAVPGTGRGYFLGP